MNISYQIKEEISILNKVNNLSNLDIRYIVSFP